MPLNRQRVLPPKSMYDLLNKMYNGYYEVNTEVVRETMRAIFPPINDRSSVGTYIGKECKHMPIYRLEKVNYTGELLARDVFRSLFSKRLIKISFFPLSKQVSRSAVLLTESTDNSLGRISSSCTFATSTMLLRKSKIRSYQSGNQENIHVRTKIPIPKKNLRKSYLSVPRKIW